MSSLLKLQNLMIDIVKIRYPESNGKPEIKYSQYSKKESELYNCIDSLIVNNVNSFNIIQINKFKCSFCKVKRPCVKLECLHRVCRKCYLEQLVKATQGTMNQKVKIFCKKCKDVEIKPEKIVDICPIHILQEIRTQNQLKALEYTCKICNQIKNRVNSRFVELLCGHIFCLDCIKPSIGIQLYNPNSVDMNLYCSICNPTLKANIGIISKKLFFKYFQIEGYEKLLESISLLRIEKNPYYPLQTYTCSYCNNGTTILIQRGQQEATCPNCRINCCPRCISREIHIGITCEQFQELRKKRNLRMRRNHFLQAKENEYENYRRQRNIRRCPHCQSEVLKVSGCNYVYCPCGKQFCNICERKLDPSLHNSHFQAGGFRCKGEANLQG